MNQTERNQIPADFIREHFDPGDKLCIALIERSTGQTQQEIKAAHEIVEPRYLAHLRAANASGKDVYVTMNSLTPEAMGRTKSDIQEVRHIYLDVDKGGGDTIGRMVSPTFDEWRSDYFQEAFHGGWELRSTEEMKRQGAHEIYTGEGLERRYEGGWHRMPPPHTVLESSPGKFQVLWEVDGFSKEQAEQLMRDAAVKFETDRAATDCSRVMRVPGFRNHKYEQPHYVSDVTQALAGKNYEDMTTLRADKIYRPEDFPAIERAPEPPRFGEKQTTHEVGTGGSQSEKDFAYACRQLEKGTSPDVIERKIADYRRERNDKAQPENYARRTVSAARAHVVSRPMAAPSAVDASERSR